MEGKDISLTEQGELIWIERLRVASFVLTVCLSEPLRALHLNETLVGRDAFKRRRNQKASYRTHTHILILFKCRYPLWLGTICMDGLFFVGFSFQMVQRFVS